MHADKVSFSELFSGAIQFKIPPFQRSYSWGERQALQLWTDIRTEAARLLNGQAAGHFLGSLVLAPSPMLAPGGLQEWLVVDGQQRLTTMIIALSAIRDDALAWSIDLAESIRKQWLVNSGYADDRRLKLLPTPNDRGAFRNVVLNHQQDVADTKVVNVYKIFRELLKEVDRSQQQRQFDALVRAISQHMHLVQIVAGPGDNAHRIFQTLNSAGLKLTETDLMRNHLFMRLPNRIDEVFRDVWTPMQKSIGDTGIEEILWIDLILRGHDTAPQTDVFRLQVERFERLTGEDQVANEMQQLAKLSRYYRLIVNPSSELHPGLRHQLERLREWGSKTSHPVTMFFLQLRDKGSITPEEASKALLLVESFCVRRAIAGIPANSLGRILSAIPRELEGCPNLVQELHKYLSAPKRHWPDDARLAEAIQTQPFYLSSKSSQRTYVLRRLEDAYNSPEPVDWTKSTLTIEHILPQSLTKEWRLSLASESERFGIGVPDLHKLVVHTLGNLTLTAENGPMSNHSFDEKRKVFRRSGLAMNRAIAESDVWNGLTISERGQLLLTLATEIWPAPLAGQQAQQNWTLLHQALAAIPAGQWTTFGDLAEVIGSHPLPVASHLASRRIKNAWRVLLIRQRQFVIIG